MNPFTVTRFSLIFLMLSICVGAHAQTSKDGQSKSPSAGLSQVDISGVTVFEPDQLWVKALNRTKDSVGSSSAASTCDAVKKIYREAGYFLADVSCGLDGSKLKVSVYEGKIRKIEISGVDSEMAKKISDIIVEAIGNGPVTLANFERGVMLAKDLSGIYLTTEVIDGGNSNNDLLRISANFVKQRGSLSIDNLPRNFGQGIYGILTEEVYSTLTSGDMFRINVLPSTDFYGQWSGVFGTGTYRAPLNNDGLYGELTVGTGLTKTYYNGSAQTPNNTFQKTNLASAIVGYPIMRNAHECLYTLSEINYYGLSGTNTGVTNTETGIEPSSCVAISRGFFFRALASCMARLVAKSPCVASRGRSS